MGVRILPDTNCISNFLNGKLSPSAIEFIASAFVEISVINRMELLSWTGATEEKMDTIHTFIKACIVHDLEEPVVPQAISIRRKHKLKLADAIIAATALVKELTLITHNKIDF